MTEVPTAQTPASDTIGALLIAHRAELVAFVQKRAGHLVDPEDIVQQAAVRALTTQAPVADPARGRAWLFRIVRNQLTDTLRKLGVPTATEVDVAEHASEPSSDGETCRCALTLAKTLKPEYSDILERAVIDDASIGSIAKDLGLSANNATVRLHRARQALRKVVQEHCGTASLRQCLACVCDERGCCAAQ